MENRIGVNRFTDKLIAKYLKLKAKKFTSNANSALVLLSKFVDDRSCGFSINYRKQPNSQVCHVTLNSNGIDYEGADGYLPMAICRLFLNSWAKGLRYYNWHFFNAKWKLAKGIHDKIEEEGWNDVTDEEIELDEFYNTFEHLVRNLDEEQIKALIIYANR